MRRVELVELEAEAARDDLEAEVEEVAQAALEVEPLGAADLGVVRRHQAGQVDLHVGLQRACACRGTP